MNHTEFHAAITRLFGTEARAARELDINPRTIRKYTADPESVSENNTRRVPEHVAAEIRALLEQFPDGVTLTDPRQTVRILHEKMQRDGWTDSEAAASILGAVVALANRILGRDEVENLLRGERE